MKDFPVIRIFRRKKISLWQVFPNSRGEGFPGGKNFLVGKMFTFTTKSFLGQPKSKNHRNFSPAAGMYWLIKQPALPLNHSFKKLPQTLSFITKLLTAQSVYNTTIFLNFFATAKVPKNFSGLQYMRLYLLYRHDFYQKTVRLI